MISLPGAYDILFPCARQRIVETFMNQPLVPPTDSRPAAGTSRLRRTGALPPPLNQPPKHLSRRTIVAFEQQMMEQMLECLGLLHSFHRPPPQHNPTPPAAVPGVAVVDIKLPSTVRSGDDVAVIVLVRNETDRAQQVDLQLFALPQELLIGRRTVTLPPGTTTSVPFCWQTADCRPGNHTLEARASILF